MKDEARPSSAIAVAFPDRVVVRGFDLCNELMGHVGLTEYFLILLTGTRPSPKLSQLVDAALVAIAEHGMVPSVQTARMTLAAAPEALQGAVSAGLLGAGSIVLGAAETAGIFLRDLVAATSGGGDRRQIIHEHIASLRQQRRPLPGFGHPLHKPEDPRALRLLAIAAELGFAGPHAGIIAEIREAITAIYGRDLQVNVNGAIAATLLDAEFPVEALKGITMIARTASLIAHLAEEQRRPIGMAISNIAAAAVAYDGPLPAAGEGKAH